MHGPAVIWLWRDPAPESGFTGDEMGSTNKVPQLGIHKLPHIRTEMTRNIFAA